MLSSNEDWPVHLDPDDRRFFVLKVSEKHKEDHMYFNAISDELKWWLSKHFYMIYCMKS